MSTRTLAYWLALVDRLVEREVTEALDEHGITRLQWRILTSLADGPATADELDAATADLPAVDDGTTSVEQLAELVESGWVTTADAYALSDRGRVAVEHLSITIGDLRERVLEGVTEQEQEVTRSALERMARNLGWTE